MSILENNVGLPNSLGGLLENVLPGSTSPTTLLGNTAGNSGVTDDLLHGAGNGLLGDGLNNAYNDVAIGGGVAADLLNGGGIGIENILSEHLPALDGLSGGSQITTALDPVADLAGNINDTLVQVGEELSPGASNPLNLTGDVIGKSGIIDDVVTNIHDGSLSGAVLDSYKDVLGPGGILDNIGDGYGSGLESLVHQLNGIEGTVPAAAEVSSLLGDISDTLASTVNSLSPGATSPLTTTGDIIGPSGVLDDISSNLSHGSITGGVVASYDDVFAKGGLVNNLADGHGLGTESLIGSIANLVNGVGSTDAIGSSGPLTDVLGHAGALLGDSGLSGVESAGHSDVLGGLLGDHDISGVSDALHFADHHVA